MKSDITKVLELIETVIPSEELSLKEYNQLGYHTSIHSIDYDVFTDTIRIVHAKEWKRCEEWISLK